MSGTVKIVLLAAAVLLTAQGFVSDTLASSVKMKASIAFDQAIYLSKTSDVTAGTIAVRPHDRVAIDNAGVTTLEGQGQVLNPVGRATEIVIGGARDQTLNFLTTNFAPGGGIAAVRAHCTINGGVSGGCDAAPISGKQLNTLIIGMDMTIADSTPAGDRNPPSFDMSVVYQ